MDVQQSSIQHLTSPVGATVTWPLVGRDDAMHRIENALDQHRTGRPTAVLLQRPAGVGRTRLVREVLAAAGARGWATRWVGTTGASSEIPFAAVACLLPPDTDNALQLFLRTAEHLHKLAGGRPVLVGVDDAHLLDRSSAALLHHLAVARDIGVVAALRDGESCPDPLHTLAADDHTVTVQLEPLSPGQVTTLLQHVLGDEVDAGAAHRLWTLSEGNPLLLREVVDAARQRGSLCLDQGRWGLHGPVVGDGALPAAMAASVTQLSPDVRAALDVVVIAEPISVDLVETIVGPALEAAEAAGLVTVTSDEARQQVSMTNPLLAEALRAHIPTLRRRRISRQLADATEATGLRKEDVLRLAVWRLDAGDRTDPDLFERAARQARESWDYPLAERLARVAIDGGGHFGARLVHAESVCAQGQIERAARLLAELQADADDDGQMVEAVTARAFMLLQGDGRAQEADRLLQLAQRSVCDQTRRDELALARASLAMNMGQFATAVAATAAVYQRPDATAGNRLGAAVVGVSSLAISGRPCEALELCAQSLDASPHDGSQPSTMHLLDLGRCLALAFAGRLDDAEALALRWYRVALTQQVDTLRGQWALPLGSIALLRGRPDTAAAHLREAAALIGEEVTELSRFPEAYCLGSLAEASALVGDEGSAAAALAQARAATPTAYVPTVDRGDVWLTVAQGELTRARELASCAAARAGDHGAHAFQAFALYDLARLGEATTVAPQLRQLTGRLDGPVWTALASHVVAMAHNDAYGLEQCGAQLADLELMLLAAEASTQAAAVYRDTGRAGSAMAADRRTQAWFGQCETVRTPALSARPARAERHLLTSREHEVAGLAARGMTNRNIADTLVVSPRTVANHLYRVYAKLNITGRDNLAELLGSA